MEKKKKKEQEERGGGGKSGKSSSSSSSNTAAAAPRSAISKSAGAAADVCFEPDRDALVFGRFALRPLATPGHTKGCCSFYLAPDEWEKEQGGGSGASAAVSAADVARRLGRRRRRSPGLVFSGDALLIRGCGRTDFQGGSAEELFASVRGKLFALPDDTLVFPAHDYKGMTSSAIGEEKRHNPRLGLARSEAEFVEIMASLDLPRPRMIDEAVPANMRCGV